MIDALSTAVSGLKAQTVKLQTTAGNVANVSTAGAIPGSPSAPAGSNAVYKPLSVSLTAQQGGGVSAEVVERPDSYSVISDPQAAYADAAGLVAVPNVDLAEEAVNQVETRGAFQANAAVIRTTQDMMRELLDTLA